MLISSAADNGAVTAIVFVVVAATNVASTISSAAGQTYLDTTGTTLKLTLPELRHF